MIQKMLINEFLTMVPTYATSWNWFVCIFSRESWYREVQGSFLSPFHDHFCFPSKSSSTSTNKSNKNREKKKWGMVRDALGGIGGSSLSIFTGFSKDFEKLNFQKLKIDRNRFKMG